MDKVAIVTMWGQPERLSGVCLRPHTSRRWVSTHKDYEVERDEGREVRAKAGSRAAHVSGYCPSLAPNHHDSRDVFHLMYQHWGEGLQVQGCSLALL